ncbi:MAG: helix-turn-helix transcriptional regulator [Acidimicrobiales bacterium]
MPDASTLGSFIRSRRERLSPGDVGLPAAGRRRTPGLRREEVAVLAGISVDYLVRLEQGRDVSPSAAVLAALSDALRLTEEERRHLGGLGAALTQTEMCPRDPPARAPLSATAEALLDRLDPTPAYVLEPWGEVLAWNQGFDRLMRPLGLFDLNPANLVRHAFLTSAARAFYRDWHEVAREQAGFLRGGSGRCGGDAAFEDVVGELTAASPEFARLWANHELAEHRSGVHRLSHPTVGRIDLAYEGLLLSDAGRRRLVTYLPAREADAVALDRIVAPGRRRADGVARLRVVEGA